MIEYLSGRLIDKTPTHVVVLCGGVGYGASISLATYEQLPDVGRDTALFAHMVVREDSIALYGFATTQEREMFELLISVSGIGPKIAMGVLSSVGVDTLRENIARGNAAALTALPGIGRKTAERIGVELRDKFSATVGPTPGDGDVVDSRGEALAALMALGYSRPAAEKALRAALKGHGDAERSAEELIKAALKQVNE